MPPIGTQLDLPWTLGGAGGGAGFTVARALMKPGRKYAEAVRRFEPYDQGREPQPELRRGLLRVVRGAHGRGNAALIPVNNRPEGNTPRTGRAPAEVWGEQADRERT